MKFSSGILTLFSLILFAWSAVAQPQTVEAQQAIQGIISDLKTPFVKGYQKSGPGETIVYHSANEYVQQALLARTLDGNGRIEWTTDNVPAVLADTTQTFVWMAGLAGSMGVHHFELSIDSIPAITFSSSADSMRKVFVFDGQRGERLRFIVTNVDQFGDLFGYMFLRMPSKLLNPGHPLALKVVGSSEGSPAWYMTFQHELEPRVRVEALPLLVSRGDSALQLIRVGIERYGEPVTFDVYVDPTNRVKRRLQWGLSTVMLPVAAVSKPETKRVIVESSDKVMKSETVAINPVRRRTFYLLPHSHTDIGYSDYQATVEQHHMKYVDDAIAIAERTSTYPEGARFKWNIEVMWPLESYLNRATESQKARLVDAVKRGWIGLNGLYANILTGLCRPEELIHATDFARVLEKRYGLNVTSAMITDIPAYTSSTVTALSLAGVKYFSSGPNYMPTTPDGGDRIGYALKMWGDKPFYWQSKSKEHKLLFWMAGRGYSWFHGLNMGNLRTASISTICQYLNELDAKSYPYDMVQVRYTVGGDNGPPDPDLSDCVKRWNEQYLSPKMVIATSDEMFEKFERRYGDSLPVFDGDLTPYWEDGAVSTAREVAANRNAAENLVQIEALQALTDRALYDSSASYSAWRDIVLFDEHTWGAANSVSEPNSPGVKAQWEYKKSFVDEATRKVREMFGRSQGGSRTGTSLRSVDIVNTNSWPRTDLVLIPGQLSTGSDIVRDGNGKTLLSQRMSTGDLAVLVSDVPPFGFRRLAFSKSPARQKLPDLPIGNKKISNGAISLRVDETTGAMASLKWNGFELVDTSGGAGLNQYFYVPGRDPHVALTDLLTNVSVKERGPLVASLLVESAPAGTNALRREIRLVKGIDRIDITDVVDKKNVREKESVHLGFPFLVPDGIVRMDGGWDVIRPETDQLPGSCKDFFSVQRWVDISNGLVGITWANPDAPLVEIGEMTDEALNDQGHRVWRKVVQPSRTIYSYAMNNYWHTNYKAEQDGEIVLRYSIIPHGKYDAARAERFGIEQGQPLLVIPARETKSTGRSLFNVLPTGVIATSLKPSNDKKGFIIRLYNATEDSVGAGITWNAGRVRVYRSTVSEDRGTEVKTTVPLPAFGAATLRIESWH